MKRLVLLFFFLITAPAMAQAPSAAPVVRAPYRIDYGGWFTVSVMVDGKGPFDFIIDTGATETLIFENLATSQNYRLSDKPRKKILGMSATAEFPTYEIGDISFGAAKIQNANCVVLQDWLVDDRSPHGVLGLDILGAYRVVFDANRQEVLLYESGAPLTPLESSWSSAPIAQDDFGLDAGNLFTVVGSVDRTRVRFIIDLGAAGTVINRIAAGRMVQNRNEFSLSVAPRLSTAPLGQVTDALDEKIEAQTVLVHRFRVGDVSWAKKVFIAHNAHIFEELGVSDEPFGLFGADLLRDRSFALDFPAGRLLIGPRGGRKS